MSTAFQIIGGVAVGWCLCAVVWTFVASALTGIVQSPLDFLFVWRWRRASSRWEEL